MMLDEEHYGMISPLQQLNVGLVSQCVLDYMQLVCLGIVQKLIFFWLDGQLSTRLSSITVHAISLRMLSFVIHMPRVASFFARNKMWKATQLQQFLFHTGPVVLYK